VVFFILTCYEKKLGAGAITAYATLLDREKTNEPVRVLLMVKLKNPNTTLFEAFERMVCAMQEVPAC
jgi:hypothetical protein